MTGHFIFRFDYWFSCQPVWRPLRGYTIIQNSSDKVSRPRPIREGISDGKNWVSGIYVHCLKEVTTSKLSVTLANLNRFLKIFALLEITWNLLQNPYDITHFTLGMLLHYLGKLKIQILCTYSADMEDANKLHFESTDFNSATRGTVKVSVFICV